MRSVGSWVGGAPGKPRAAFPRRPVGFTEPEAQSATVGAGAGKPATGADLGSRCLGVLICALQAKEVRGAWQVWAPRGLGDRSCLLKCQETKQTSLSPFLPHEKIILFVFSISFHLTAGKAGCSGGLPWGCRWPTLS